MCFTKLKSLEAPSFILEHVDQRVYDPYVPI